MAALDGLPPLRDVIQRHGLDAKKALGQNFLLDLNLTQKIARTAGAIENHTVIEVGPGPGGLTAELARRAGRVVALEKDPVLARAIAGRWPNVEVVEGDWRALGLDVWTLALEAPPGEWSEVVETAGAFVLFRVLEPPGARGGEGVLAVERALVPYLETRDARGLIESVYDQVTLTVVDPAWAEIVPEHYKYRMGVEGPGAG